MFTAWRTHGLTSNSLANPRTEGAAGPWLLMQRLMPADASPLTASCCWSKWGTAAQCGRFPSDAIGGCCNTNWAKTCGSDADCPVRPVLPPPPLPKLTNLPHPPLPPPPPPSPPLLRGIGPREFSSHDGQLFVGNKTLLLKGVNWYGFETQQGVVHGLYAQPPSVFLGILQEHEFNAVRIPVDLDLVLHDRRHGYIKPEPGAALVEEEKECFQPTAVDDASLQEAALNASVCGGVREPRSRPIRARVTATTVALPDLSGPHLTSPCVLDARRSQPSPLMKNTSFQVLQILVDMLAERGILVLLDLHCLSTRGTNASPRFYDASHTVDQTVAGWAKLARVFGPKWCAS